MINAASAPNGVAMAEAKEGESPGTPSKNPDHLGQRFRRAAPWLIGALVGLPIVVAVASVWNASYYPTFDVGFIELRVIDIGTEPPLAGPYSRFGWSHPGPLMFYLLAPAYWLDGSSSAGLLVGAGVIALASIAGICLLAYRRGNTLLLAATGIALLGLFAAQDVKTFLDPWNPFLALLPFALFLFLCWSVAVGDLVLLPVLAFVASFLVQTHVGYLGFVGVLTAFSLAALAVALRRDMREPVTNQLGRHKRIGMVALVTVAVTVVCWIPVLVEQVTNEPGNVGLLVRHFVSGSGTDVSGSGTDLGTALGVLSGRLGGWPEWLSGSQIGEVRIADPMLLVFFVGPSVAALIATVRMKLQDEAMFVGVTLLGTATGLVSITQVDGEVFDYLVAWTRPLGVVSWIAVVWAVIQIARTRGWLSPRFRQLSGVAAGVLLVALSLFASVGQGDLKPHSNESEKIRGLTPSVIDALDPAGGPVDVVPLAATLESLALLVGLQVQLERAGFDVIVTDPSLVARYGRHRVLEASADGTDQVETQVVVVAPAAQIPEAEARDDLTEVAFWVDEDRGLGPVAAYVPSDQPTR